MLTEIRPRKPFEWGISVSDSTTVSSKSVWWRRLSEGWRIWCSVTTIREVGVGRERYRGGWHEDLLGVRITEGKSFRERFRMTRWLPRLGAPFFFPDGYRLRMRGVVVRDLRCLFQRSGPSFKGFTWSREFPTGLSTSNLRKSISFYEPCVRPELGVSLVDVFSSKVLRLRIFVLRTVFKVLSFDHL